MVNKNKVIIMSKMALHDKRYGESDRAAYSYFRRDYIYRKNVWTRICVSVGAVFLLGIYWLYEIFIYGVDLNAIDIQQSVMDSVLFLIAVMAVYTFIGTVQGTHEYHKIQKRMDHYMALMERLDRLPDNPARKAGDSALVYDKRNPRRRPN